MVQEKIVGEQQVEVEEEKKHSGKGTKITTFILGIINLCILIFTILFFCISFSIKNKQAENSGEALALIFVIIIFYGFPLVFTAANLAVGIPGVVTGAVSVKRSEKKALSIVGLSMNCAAIITAVTLTVLLFL